MFSHHAGIPGFHFETAMLWAIRLQSRAAEKTAAGRRKCPVGKPAGLRTTPGKRDEE